MVKLHIIPGSPPPDTAKQRVIDRVRKAPRPAVLLQCHRCGGREVIESRIGATLKNGALSGGAKQILCATCLMKGERIVIA